MSRLRGAGFRNPPLVYGRSIVVVARGSKVSKIIEAVREEVLAGSATGQVCERGDRGGRGGGILRLSCDMA